MPKQLTKIIQVYTDGSIDLFDPPSLPQPAPPPPVTSGIIKGGYFDGIPDNRAKEFADQFGMGWVRMWHTIKWDETIGVAHPTLIRAAALQAQGLKVLVVCTPPEKTGTPPATSGVAYTYFKSMLASAQKYIDAWEIWNEPNLANYNASYPQSASLWIRNALMPAYQALHEEGGQFVVSGGWSEGFKGAGGEYAITNGLLKFCDAMGYHPYGSTSTQQIQRVSEVRSMIGNKPLWLTEWNLHMDTSNPAQWTTALYNAAKEIAPQVQAVFHFRMVQTAQPAGVAAPLDVNLNGRGIFYSGTVAAMNAF